MGSASDGWSYQQQRLPAPPQIFVFNVNFITLSHSLVVHAFSPRPSFKPHPHGNVLSHAHSPSPLESLLSESCP